jgi:hypothetical protein
MSTLGFEEYVEPLKLHLHKYREVRAPSRGVHPRLISIAPCDPRNRAISTY